MLHKVTAMLNSEHREDKTTHEIKETMNMGFGWSLGGGSLREDGGKTT